MSSSPRPRRAACLAPACGSRTRPLSSGTTPSGWCRQSRKSSKLHALGAAAARAPALWTACELARCDTSPLAAAGLIGDADQAPAGFGQAPERRGGAGDQRDVADAQRRLRAPADRDRDQLVDHAVAVDEHRAPRRSLAIGGRQRLPVARLHGQVRMGDERVPDDRLEGLHQRRLEIVRGVDDDGDVGELGQRAVRRARRRRRSARRARGRSSIALTRLTETLCSRIRRRR